MPNTNTYEWVIRHTQWVMSHKTTYGRVNETHMSHATYVHTWRSHINTHTWVMPHTNTYEGVITHTHESFHIQTHMNEPYDPHARVMPHNTHGQILNESCHLKPHMNESYDTHTHESFCIPTHINESYYTRTTHAKYEHIWISHLTHTHESYVTHFEKKGE